MPPPNLEALLIQTFFPERTPGESALTRDWLHAHGVEYDAIEFSVRVGQGLAPNPEHPPGIQRMAVHNSRKRIDVLARRGAAYTLVEVKRRVSPEVLGKLRTYRQLFLEEHPEVDDVALVVVGEFVDDDTLRVLMAEGIDVLIYEPTPDRGAPAAGGL